MSHIIGSIFEGLIQYTFLGVVIALFLMFILLILLYARDHIMSFLRIPVLGGLFEQLCELSDRLDEGYAQKNIYSSAMWLTRLLWMGAISAAGLMVLWIMVRMIRG